MFYAYILRSINSPEERYIGSTGDLRRRLGEHNAGRCPHTSRYAPWTVDFYAAFNTLEKAHAFELYLKSGSGHEFARRHF